MADLDPAVVELSALELEFMAGYFDGRNPDSPEPSGNRSEAYRHSFEVARAEVVGRPIPAAVSRAKAAMIDAREGGAG